MKSIDNYMYSPQDLQLAREIADRLQDPNAFKQFLRYTQKFPHGLLREKLSKVCSYPAHRITTSRAAYFVFLIEQLDYSKRDDNALGRLADSEKADEDPCY